MRYVLACVLLIGCTDSADPHEFVTCEPGWTYGAIPLHTCEAACVTAPDYFNAPRSSPCIPLPGSPPKASNASLCQGSHYREFDGEPGCCIETPDSYDDGPLRMAWYGCQ